MKKLITLGIATLAILSLTAAASYAGDFHSKGSSINCNQCHILHYSETHPLSSARTTATGGPFPKLLRAGNVNELCLFCHDGESEPDVLYDDANATTDPVSGAITSNRQAGALNMLGGGNALWAETDGHTLNSHAAAPGATDWTNDNGLDCVDCHQPHGRTADGQEIYRNLNIFITSETPTAYMTYAKTTNVLTKDVFETASNAHQATEVNFNMPDVHGSAYAKFCGQCHTNFHGAAGDVNMGGEGGVDWKRHPVADAMIGAAGGGHSSVAEFTAKAYRVQVMSASGNWGPYGSAWSAAPDDIAPSCFSCHKAHGSQRPFGLIYATGTNPPGENGDDVATASKYIVLCRQCHVQ